MSNSVHVLVAEDQESLRLLFSHVVRFMGYECDLASNGRECLLRITQSRYDIVFLDLVMPEIDGETALRWIKNHAPGTSVVVTSIQDDEGIIRRMLALGATAYLTKPFSVNEIKKIMQGILNRRTRDGLNLAAITA